MCMCVYVNFKKRPIIKLPVKIPVLNASSEKPLELLSLGFSSS